MDKTVIFAVAGSGKTTHIVETLTGNERCLLLTYTIGNYCNLRNKILKKFNDEWPEQITLMTYFSFLHTFCFKPFLSDKLKTKGITYESPNLHVRQTQKAYYVSKNGYLYSNRLSLLVMKYAAKRLEKRLLKYFDRIVIDEVQDFSGRDFNFLEFLMDLNINMLFTGDFFQHTYDTSRDGNVNAKLFDDVHSYEKRFEDKGFHCDKNTLNKSWRCGPNICEFVSAKLGIDISSNLDNNANEVILIDDQSKIESILNDDNIIKLHFRNSSKYGPNHKNWGETKGEDNYGDVCVLLNKSTAKKFFKDDLKTLPSSTKNKLYVAITRAHGTAYLIEEDKIKINNV